MDMISNKKAIIIGLVLMGAYYGLFYNSGKSYKQQIIQSEQKIKTTKRQIAELEKSEEDAKRYKKLLGEFEDKLVSISKYIPEKLTDYQLMSFLSSRAKEAGAKVLSTSSAKESTVEESEDSFYQSINVELQISASFKQLMIFLSNLSKADKIVSLKRMSLKLNNSNSSDGLGANLVFNGLFTGYKYLQTSKEVIKE